EPTPEPTPKPEPTPISTSRPTLPNTAKPQTILPKTGAEKATISLLGIAILAVVVAIWRQRKKAE
ncbi:MAG TPA: LPXTG cell wall anchor domain-containing protein, partial [Candidatus Enterococcus stercoravium]|nr:LPXTG cell wall anchor domain-containing protein [Candidatus Enterococcus stercoravium]